MAMDVIANEGFAISFESKPGVVQEQVRCLYGQRRASSDRSMIAIHVMSAC